MAKKITVEVAYALPDKQKLIVLDVEEGTTAIDAAKQSGIEQQFSEIELQTAKVGIFGKSVKPDQVLRTGDRVEIYRPLKIDPKASRKERAAKAKATKST